MQRLVPLGPSKGITTVRPLPGSQSSREIRKFVSAKKSDFTSSGSALNTYSIWLAIFGNSTKSVRYASLIFSPHSTVGNLKGDFDAVSSRLRIKNT